MAGEPRLCTVDVDDGSLVVHSTPSIGSAAFVDEESLAVLVQHSVESATNPGYSFRICFGMLGMRDGFDERRCWEDAWAASQVVATEGENVILFLRARPHSKEVGRLVRVRSSDGEVLAAAPVARYTDRFVWIDDGRAIAISESAREFAFIDLDRSRTRIWRTDENVGETLCGPLFRRAADGEHLIAVHRESVELDIAALFPP